MTAPDGMEPLLKRAEVARMFRVHPYTVTRWADEGHLTAVRTLGGHRRFREAEVRALLAGSAEGTCPECHYLYGSFGHRTTCGVAS